MRIVSNTLEAEVDTWDDPGDYPNAVASGPLPSYNFISAVNGSVVLELTPREFSEYLTSPGDFLHDADIEVPSEVYRCKFGVDTEEPARPADWRWRLAFSKPWKTPVRLTISVTEFDPNPDYSPNEPEDYYDER